MNGLFGDLANAFGLHLAPYSMAIVVIIILYAIQSEVRFGASARRSRAGENDRGSTRYVSIASTVPIVGFAVVTKIRVDSLFGLTSSQLEWLLWPAIRQSWTAIGWTGAAIALAGVLVRLWALLVLRERYTRTLLVQENQTVERGGPYRIVRHPGYAGSLLFFNGVALSSCSAVLLASSVATTFAAYAYRIAVEDQMLIERFGEQYRTYRREVAGLIPFFL